MYLNKFWNIAVLPIIEKLNAKHIVEIGCFRGANTMKILKYCEKNESKLSSIDPVPLFKTKDLKLHYGGAFDFYADTSLNALPFIKDYDLVLIDGDHNWYTVYNELKLIEKSSINRTFPVILLHDVAWPYARRDVYYNPENIPEEFRHPHKKAGMKRGHSALLEKGGANASLYNAIYEGNPQNGVLTAVEDFMNQTKRNLSFKMTKTSHGFGIIYQNDADLDLFFEKILAGI